MDISQHPLLASEREGKNRTSRWGSIVVFLVGIVLSQVAIGGLLGVLGMLKEPENIMTFKDQLSWTLLFLPQTMILWLWVRFKEKRPFSSIGFQHPSQGWLRFVRGTIAGILTMLLLASMILLAGGFLRATPGPGAHAGANTLGVVLILFIGFVVQGSTEEVYTRGFLLPIWGNRGSLISAVLGQALVFMSVHLLNGHISLFPILNLLLVAVFLALVVLKEGSLWWVCGWHAGWNWCQSNVLGIPVSGIQVGNSLVLLQPSPTSPSTITGGLFGVEGSALTSLFLMIASVVTYLSIRKANLQPTSG